MSARNEQIARRALAGEQLTDLARAFGVGPVRAREILHHWCRTRNVFEWTALKRNPVVYQTASGPKLLRLDRPTLDSLRAHAAQFTA